MSAGFQSDFKEQVRTQTDLVNLVSEGVALTAQRGGREYVGLCPFHDDHNPSFRVYAEQQSYRCWVCDEGGDCFSFVMKRDLINFREALEYLAERAGIEIPKHSRSNRNSNGISNADLYEILLWAESLFHNSLVKTEQGKEALDYMLDRGFSQETILQFRIGYHPKDWNWIQNQSQGRFSHEALRTAGLIAKRDGNDGYYDHFVDRVMFPIRDKQKRTVAFGGRALPGSDAENKGKYQNSPEGPLFSKSRLLYGLDVARDGIFRTKTAIVVEGYTDCITCQQLGMVNVVGVLGTSLTEMHVQELKRFADKVILVFDGDDAGQNAADRAISKFLSQEVDLRILALPDGLDPAEYIEQNSLEKFQDLVTNAKEAWDFKFVACLEKYGTESLDSCERILNEMLELLSLSPGLAGSVRENMILGRLENRLGVSEIVIRQKYKEIRKQKRTTSRPQTQMQSPAGFKDNNRQRRIDPQQGEFKSILKKSQKYDLAEQELLEIILSAPQWIEKIQQQVSVQDFEHQVRAELLQFCFDMAEQGQEPSYHNVTIALEDPELKRLAQRIDEISREKKIAEKMRNAEQLHEETSIPILLYHALDILKFRRMEMEKENLAAKGRTQISTFTSGELSDSDRELLKQASQFHTMRAGHKK